MSVTCSDPDHDATAYLERTVEHLNEQGTVTETVEVYVCDQGHETRVVP